MKIYTKTGDDGSTGLFGGVRVEKDHPRIEACGAVDELNAVLGVAACHSMAPETRALLDRIQADLFAVGAALATPEEASPRLQARGIGVEEPNIKALEAAIDHFDALLTPLKQFILPGGSMASAILHQCRAICRRAERRVHTLNRHGAPQSLVLIYLNRLSDLLFVLARFENQRVGVADVPWQPTKS